MTDYLDKMKSIADALEAIAQPDTEYDLCNKILNGLGLEYDYVHTSIADRETLISFEELFGQLLTFELRLELHHTTPTMSNRLLLYTPPPLHKVVPTLVDVLIIVAVVVVVIMQGWVLS